MTAATWTERQRRGETEPSEYRMSTPELRIVIHRRYGIENTWFLSCPSVAIDTRELSAKSPEEAKTEALAAINERLKTMLASLPK